VRVLVTGANGFLGRAVVRAFVAAGHGVRALVRPAAHVDDAWTDSVDVVRADLRWSNDLARALDGVDALVHLAASVRGDEAEQFASTVVGTERLLEAMAESDVRRLVLASSFTVYDREAVSGTLTEAAPLATNLVDRGGYTTAKIWQERVVRRVSAEQGYQLTVLRPGVIWGRGNEYPAGIAARIGRAHVVIGGLDARMPLTYIENCAECFAVASRTPDAVGQTVNVVDGPGTSTWEYVGEHLRRTGTAGVRVPLPYGTSLFLVRALARLNRWAFGGQARLPSMFEPARFVARFKPLSYSNEAARRMGWTPQYGFAEALERTYAGG
jgi:UDP-glucose 4-epimerase